MKIAVLGYGTVGRGVCEIIEGCKDLELSKVLVRKGKCVKPFMVSDINDISKDKSIDTVVECMGGVDFAFECAQAVIKEGKNFVTSNKALVAAKGIELQKLADSKKVSFLFSAACGGAIPVLHNLSVAKKTDSVLKVMGILNGTTNFILTKMANEGLTYASALGKAQELGYAEADPTADVSGLDTLRKVMLASAVSFDLLPVEGCLYEGIEHIAGTIPRDYELRLVGSCGLNSDAGVFAFVQPMLVKKGSIFSSVKANNNMAIYEGKFCGRISLGGQGAGMYPTASAVLRDISEIAKCRNSMLSCNCKEVKADNSKIEFEYFTVENGNEKIVKSTVENMFKTASDARNGGKSFFFAAFEK